MKRTPTKATVPQDDKFLNALADAYRLQEAIISATELCIMSTNKDGIITSFNRAAEQLLGYESEEVIGKISPVIFHDFDEIIHYSQVLSDELQIPLEPGLECVIARARITREADRKEWTYLRKNGTKVPVSISVTGLWDDHDVLIGYATIATDITHRKKAEDELIRISSENLLVFNSTLSLNAVANFEGRFVRANPAWEKILGWPIDVVLARPFIEFIHPDDLKRTTKVFELLKDGRDVASFENRYVCANGTYRWLLWTAASDPVTQMVFASALDITNRKTAEEELLHSKGNMESIMHKLREQNHQLDEFAHIISHNLRSPVGNIQALLSFLTDNSTIDDYKLIFEKLKNTSANLNETMNELMDTLRIKENVKIAKSDLRFKDILDKVVQSLEGNLIQCSASVTFDFNPAPQIHYPKTYLESIFQNLLSNAIKYRSPDRHLEVHFSTDIVNGATELRVRDNGLGIDLERYGDKLFGMHKTFHEHQEARGIGLFLTKTQVETLGGEIFAESEVNVGTTFVIRF